MVSVTETSCSDFLNRDSGIVTALVAFLVIRIEAFLFDLKSGICTTDLWKMRSEKACPAGGWKEWSTFNSGWTNWLKGLYGGRHFEAVVYFCIAVSRRVRKLLIVSAEVLLATRCHWLCYHQS
jgi:hypothetical protein